jgi:transposase
MGRRRFTPEFKLEAVKLVKERGVAVRQAATDLGLHENVLREWVRNVDSHREQAFPGQGRMRPDDAEVARLRRELAKTKAERDILKKAIAYFPKRTDLSQHSPAALAAVALALNTRPRKTLGWRTPAEALDEVLRSAEPNRVATTG